MIKPDSLYNHGMKVLSYSIKNSDLNQIGWRRVGKNINYVQNNYKRKGSGSYYTLSFTVTFDFDDDSVYFAHWFPYTYTDLKYFLSDIWTEEMRTKIRKTFLARTLAGNEFEGVIITNFTSIPEEIAERKWIIITGRVHPGESNSSFIVEGIIKFLISDEEAALRLRSTFVFKVVPMLNPDGVIIGNYRCSLAGWDLNRQWKNPSPRLHPEIFAVKEMFIKTLKCRDVYLFVDCHGHSRKKNVFLYGCNNKSAVGYAKYIERVIPFICSYNNQSFSFQDCNFTIQKSREGTGRYVVYSEYNVVNSFTLEASFFSPEKGLYQDCHFTPTQYHDIGKSFWISLLEYSKLIKTPNDPLKMSCINSLDLTHIYEDIDKFYRGTQAPNQNDYKYLSQNDESDSADDDEEPQVYAKE